MDQVHRYPADAEAAHQQKRAILDSLDGLLCAVADFGELEEVPAN